VPLQYVASYLARGVDESIRAGFDIRPSHFVERHGGLLIVALGESIVAVGIGVGDLQLNLPAIATAVLGLGLAAALWWTYFGADEKQAEVSLRAAALNDRVTMALNGYFYAFVPMLLGITSLAAGVKLSISTIEARLSFGPALLLGGGITLYLIGDALFRWVMRIQHGGHRLVFAAVALASVLVGTTIAGLAQLIGLMITLIVMVALPYVRTSRGAERHRPVAVG
jgi:low temperature requirement protein LtrA